MEIAELAHVVGLLEASDKQMLRPTAGGQKRLG
jgi:hypothetical protein